jgi:hypothetical protein
MCQTLCEIPSPKNAAPLLNYACRTGNRDLLLFGLKMGGNLSQVRFSMNFAIASKLNLCSQSVVSKRGLTCMHLAAQFGHVELLQTIIRVANKMNMAKCFMMFDR